MSTSHDLVAVVKAELKQQGITYAALARELDLAESIVKRMI
jgi:lambda repressor-like predicted transcriptional regulator